MKAFSGQPSAVSVKHGGIMSASFCITPTKPSASDYSSDMEVNLEEFVNGLKKEFPGIDVFLQAQSSLMSVRWELNYYNCDDFPDCMAGAMSDNRRWVYLDAHSARNTIAKFAKWYRRLVPNIYQLYVAPSWSMESFELLLSMSEADIMRSLHELAS